MLLRTYLPEVLDNTNAEIADVIVADNGSTDESRQVLEKEFPEVKTMLFDKNYGFAEGYNRAIASARDYPLTVLLNSDVAPDKGWIEALTSFMDAHPRVAGCQPKILSYNDPERFEYAGAAGGFLDRNGYPYCRGRIFDTCEKDEGQYDAAIEVDWASGAALMVRTGLYEQAGGLDPQFFAHMEEIDLCWRLRALGYSLYAVPAATVRHLGGGSLPASNPRKTYLNFRNNLLMLHKNLPASVAGKRLIVRRLLDTIAWAKFVATLDFRNAAAVIKAHRDFAKMRSLYPRHAAADPTPKRPNILIEYYLKGKKTFSQLKK